MRVNPPNGNEKTMHGDPKRNSCMLQTRDKSALSIEKLDELKVTVEIHDVSVVCVSETWFKDYMGKDSLNLYGFNLERKDRKNGRARGVACYLRTDILYSRLCAYEDDELEVIWIKVMPKRLPRTIS